MTQDNANLFYDATNHRLGLGTTAPSTTLDVNGTAHFTGATTLDNTFSQNGANTFSTGTGAVSLNGPTSVTGTNTFTVGTGLTTLGGDVNITGNVGIGTVAPLELLSLGTEGTNAGVLSLAGATSGKAIIVVGAAAGTPTLTLPTTTGTLALISDLTSGYIPYTGGTSNVDLGIHNLTVDTDTFFVDSVNHRVGIGTTSPPAATKLTLDGLMRIRQPGTTRYRGDFNVASGILGINSYDDGGGGYETISFSGQPIIFNTTTGGAETVRINSSGYVGIGTGASVPSPLTLALANTSALTDFLINPTAKTSGNLIDAQINGTSKFKVSNTGVITIAGGLTASGTILTSGEMQMATIEPYNETIQYLNRSDLPINTFPFIFGNVATSQASGSGGLIKILPKYNQTGGSTAANTDLLINRTETAIGSGAQYLIDAGVGGGSYVSKFNVSNTGQGYFAGALTALSFNGNTITTGTGILTLGASKTLTASDSTTLATNAITLGGGEVITFSPANALSLLTTGTTSVTLPTAGTLISTDQTVGQTIGDTTNRLTKLWATDITVSNTITGSVSGNAGTVTNGVYTNTANSMTNIAPLTTLAESWIGPSSTAGIYFKGGNVGIGTTSPGSTLDVKGTLRLSGSASGYVGFASQPTAGNITYVFPNSDGTNNYVLTTDGNGNLSWTNKTGGTPGTISSINGDSSAAQTINGTGSMSVVDNTATHTVTLSSTGTTGSSGYAAFWSGANGLNADSNFFWDNTNKRLGIGTAAPGTLLQLGAGSLTWATDNTQDIGANGATRPRTGYFGTSIVAPTVNATTALQINGTTVLSGTTLGSTIVSSSLTSVGTLTGLTMGGDIAMGTHNISGRWNFYGHNIFRSFNRTRFT